MTDSVPLYNMVPLEGLHTTDTTSSSNDHQINPNVRTSE